MAKQADINSWIDQLKRCEYIKESEVKQLCMKAKEILLQESNVQHVESPVTVSLGLFKFVDLWGHPRVVLRLDGVVSGGGGVPGDQLLVHGGLRG